MPKPQFRSRSYRRIHVKTPSGKSKIHFEKKKNKIAHCSKCGNPLNGVKINKVYLFSLSEKRPERPFGGYLCHKCLEDLIKMSVRGIS
ncbi:50S ribosomal protein L34e [Acidianus sp. HS-5]|uniref:50S ribosomal protein L34e n=1 Tax=Acidianus sp. HS-5 TaxID=2886040 RepID=UPI001F44F149|nr:50S ribosomal protein L34e [Acidianus sp. HS-5]BDC19354.1 50S ribosomal protein L34e [Acidianus sp. HS-5]